MTQPVDTSSEVELAKLQQSIELARIQAEREKGERRFVLIAGFGKWSIYMAALAAITAVLFSHSGKETVVKYIADLPILVVVSIASAALGWILYLNERRMFKGYIERHHPREAFLEKQIDPRRTSSRLTPRGETSKEDRL